MELCAYGIYSFFPHFANSQYTLHKEKNLTNDTGHTIESNVMKLVQILSTFEEIKALRAKRVKKLVQIMSTFEEIKYHRIYKTNRNKYICQESKTLNLEDVDENKYSDNSVSNNDLVQLQYLHLPYPTIRYDTIETEYKYYRSQNSDYPLSVQYSMKLEDLNHYLYQGQNNFEYVFIFPLTHIILSSVFLFLLLLLYKYLQETVSSIDTGSRN